jgi:hypothetical protein
MEEWRADSCGRIVEFSERMRSVTPVDSLRLRTLLAAGEVPDSVVRGTMHSLKLNFDQVLIIIGGFIEGAGYELPASERLQGEVALLAKVGLVRGARPGRSTGGWNGLTERGRQLAVYTIYRILTAAANDGTSDE